MLQIIRHSRHIQVQSTKRFLSATVQCLAESTSTSTGSTGSSAPSSASSSSSSSLPPSSSSSSRASRSESLDPATNTDKYLLGTPHPISNLRPVRYPIPANESAEDREFRLHQERVDAFNQQFWVANNTLFITAKAEYEAKIRAANGDVAVTSDELSVFYKDFLDKAYDRQMAYNRQWWIENIGLLLPASKAIWRKWTARK